MGHKNNSYDMGYVHIRLPNGDLYEKEYEK